MGSLLQLFDIENYKKDQEEEGKKCHTLLMFLMHCISLARKYKVK